MKLPLHSFAGTALLLLFLLLSSCAGIRPGSSAAARSLYTTFMVEDRGLQYFIKPLRFTSKDGEELLMDITFRYRDELAGDANYKFSYTGKTLTKELHEVRFENPLGTWTAGEVDFMFVEREGKNFQSRQETLLPLAATKQLFSSPDWSIRIIGPEGFSQTFLPRSNTRRAITRLNHHIFELF